MRLYLIFGCALAVVVGFHLKFLGASKFKYPGLIASKNIYGAGVKGGQVISRNGKLWYKVWVPNANFDVRPPKRVWLPNANLVIRPPKKVWFPNANLVIRPPKRKHKKNILQDDIAFRSFRASLPVEYIRAVVDVAIVCDKKFGDLFSHNLERIHDYWTKYMWEVNMNFKTLPSTYISIRVTSIITISTPEGQPFIEGARRSDGKISHHQVLRPFGSYMYEQSKRLPPFAVAMLVTNEKSEGYVVSAKIGSACDLRPDEKTNRGHFIIQDSGRFLSTLTTSRQLANALGAPFDKSIPWCNTTGYIMSNGNHFFSPCSDITINNYFRSSGTCMLEDSAHSVPILSPYFDPAPGPNAQTFCKNYWKDKGQKGKVKAVSGKTSCQIKCSHKKSKAFAALDLLSNSPCDDNGQCFRNRCLPPGYIIYNVGSGQCMKSTNRFVSNDVVKMVECPTRQMSTPLDRFVVAGGKLSTPYSIQENDYLENEDKCLVINEDFDLVFKRCSNIMAKTTKWIFIKAQGTQDQFLIKDEMSELCVKQVGNEVWIVIECNEEDLLQLFVMR